MPFEGNSSKLAHYHAEGSFTIFNGACLKIKKSQMLWRFYSVILPGPLNGLIIVGFCYYVSGPVALQNLADQGALVIKIEGTPVGDPTRYVFSDEMFNSLSRNQLSVFINFKIQEDRDLLKKLLAIADVIVDNRSVSAKNRDEVLQEYLQHTAKLQTQIYCSIGGYPNAQVNQQPGLDASVQGTTGYAYTNGDSNQLPMKVGTPILDQVTGLLAAYLIGTNLYLLKKNNLLLANSLNNCIFIAVSLAGTSIWLQTGQVLKALKGEEFFRSGNQDQFAVPFSYYTARDGLISIATVNENQFRRFCYEVLEDEGFHEKYSDFNIRLNHQDQFESDLNEILIKQDKSYWVERCCKSNVVASPVLKVTESVKQNFVKQELLDSSSDGKTIVTNGATNSLFPSKSPHYLPAPELDQHTEEVKKILNLTSFTSKL